MEKHLSTHANCRFGRKSPQEDELGPGSQNSFQVDLKACDCFNALNTGIAQRKGVHQQRDDSGGGGGRSKQQINRKGVL